MSGYSSHSDGMAMNWVLEHVMTHPESYGSTLPLRTIYTLNANTASSSPDDFKTILMEHLSQLPEQPCTLPPVFLTSFIRKSFPSNLDDVDFNQALTALDYIRDLDYRRKKELIKAVNARGAHDPKTTVLQERACKLDLLYARALAGIRRWTLIAELNCPRFNKFNCVALLNTLYPIDEKEINRHLTQKVLAQQRLALWKYITAVEKNGPAVLDTVCTANGGWESVSNSVRVFCRVSLDMIQRAEDLARPTSFGSMRSDSTEIESPISEVSPIKSSGGGFLRRDSEFSDSEPETSTGKKNSTLEKIVRGIQRLGPRSASRYNLRAFASHDWSGSDEDIKMRH